MLAVVKKPRIEISLSGEGAREALSRLARKFKRTVVGGEANRIPIEETDFWKEIRFNRVGICWRRPG
jgi:sulfite reductase beta subunit-like hemoprotein